MMGPLLTFVLWSPEDDLLLKNAVEAGASLESLAKGAVQFSRSYSIREIEDRWHSILYDPIISAEAAAGMTSFELSTSPLPSKFYNFGDSKERDVVSVKRKAESVRSSYYGMCKRVCNNTITSMDLTFLVDPENDNYLMNESETLVEYCMPDSATSNHFENLDVVHYDFPENTMDHSVASNGVISCKFYNGVEDPVEESFCTIAVKEEPQIRGDNGSLNGSVEELAIDNLIGDDNFAITTLSIFDHINNDPGNLCSKFDGKHVFDPPELECGTSFDALQLSPLPQMPMWATDETFQESVMPCVDFKDSITCGDDYLAELSNSLLNFTNEEEFYLMDVDGKDRIDKSYYDGLNSLLLNSPNDVPDQIPRDAETESLVVSRPHVSNPSVSCHTEVDDKTGFQSSDAQVAHKLQSQMPSSASVRDPRFPERINGVIFCRISTEDPEVPSNDDVFLPFDVPPSTLSSASRTSKEFNIATPSSVMDCGFSNQRASETGKILKQVEQKNPRESRASSQNTGTPPLPMYVVVSKVKCEFPSSYLSHTVARSADALIHENPRENATNVDLAKHQSNHVTSSFSEKPGHGSNNFRNHPQLSGSGIKQELAVDLPIQDHQLQHSEVGHLNALESYLVANPPTFDDEEQYFESDDDVPYFSDIEAMILDMDLDPNDQDLYYNEEVSRYQHAETKRTIIRLEQGAHSHMQRAIASHGAFAILYGRRSKHFIKKAEVVLGRATESVPVDIDLRKEGHANIISRRQAVIKMDKDGFFYIKNSGKGLISVNNKEVHTGQSQRLHSNCLVELRGLQFIFETNQSRVMQYLDQHITHNS